jgi:peptidoglycan/LPS O-acetylase OafA/YrhL
MSTPAVPILSDLPEVTAIPVPKRRPPSVDRMPVLDGIRGIAILLVMTLHFEALVIADGTLPWERVYGDVVGIGWAGVDLFFVLSGFLITGILYDSRESRHYFRVFYGRRTVRIFPLYYAALVIFLLIDPFVHAHLHGIALAGMGSTNAANLFSWTYLLNWYEGYKGWNVVAHPLQHFWSLAIEEQFYLVWPFLVLKLPRRRLMGVCFGLMVLALSLRISLFCLHFPYATYTWTVCRADSLAMGSVVALAARDPGDWKTLLRWARRLALPALGAIILGLILHPQSAGGPANSPTFFMNTFELTLLGIFFGTCIAMAVALHKESSGYRVLASPFLRFFGKYSYCLYVCHLPIVVVFAKAGLNRDHLVRILHSELFSVLAVNAIGFAVCITVALASWHLYEKQWLKLKHLRGLQRPD